MIYILSLFALLTPKSAELAIADAVVIQPKPYRLDWQTVPGLTYRIYVSTNCSWTLPSPPKTTSEMYSGNFGVRPEQITNWRELPGTVSPPWPFYKTGPAMFFHPVSVNRFGIESL